FFRRWLFSCSVQAARTKQRSNRRHEPSRDPRWQRHRLVLFYIRLRLLVGLRNDTRSNMTIEGQFLTVIDRTSPVGKYSCAVAPLNFDTVVASINSGLKIESRRAQ